MQAPESEPPEFLLPPSPPVFTQTEIMEMELKTPKVMSMDYHPRSAPSKFQGFDEMVGSLRKHRDSFVPSISPLMESNNEDAINNDMSRLDLQYHNASSPNDTIIGHL